MPARVTGVTRTALAARVPAPVAGVTRAALTARRPPGAVLPRQAGRQRTAQPTGQPAKAGRQAAA